MTQPSVSVPSFDAANDKPFGPARIEHRSAGAALEQLGTYFMVFDAEGFADPWTLQYEETIYVIEGECRLVVHEDGAERTVSAAPGELVVLRKGATVQYGGTVGTRLLLSIAPVDWRTRA
jgi:ethanolamine utilization protein EutQ (cupin superfamily)